MKAAVLGANWSPCAEPMDQTVVPATGLPSLSVQVNAVPPHSCTSIPRCRLYQACSAGASLALKKIPPMPVTRFIDPPRSGAPRLHRGPLARLNRTAARQRIVVEPRSEPEVDAEVDLAHATDRGRLAEERRGQ